VAVPLMAMMVVGAAVSAAGAMSQANAQKQAANYNAQLRERDATIAVNQANEDADRFQRRAQQDIGALHAGLGATGTTSDDMDVLRMSVSNAKLDEETIRYKGRMQATGYYDEAILDRYSGRMAEEQGYYRAASSLLTGAGQAGSSYMMSRQRLNYVGA